MANERPSNTRVLEPEHVLFDARLSHALDRARHGDLEPIGQILEGLRPFLTKMVRRRSSVRDADAEEHIQNAFVSILEKVETFENGGFRKFRGYVARSVVNSMTDDFRRGRKSAPLERVGHRLSVIGVDEDRVAARVDGQSVSELLGVMKPTMPRKVLHLQYIEDMNTREIARKLGCSANMVRTHRHRGLRQLRRIVGDK